MTITRHDVEDLPYVALLARLSESNRPPGGMETVQRMIAATGLRPGQRALHAGCNAGFLSREIAHRTGATVTGIDLSPQMADSAQRRAVAEEAPGPPRYANADMRALPFATGAFDVTFSGGALAFVHDARVQAIEEWIRVTRSHGLLADAELFYVSEPPASLLQAVGDIIGVDVPQYQLQYWLDLFDHPRLERYSLHVHEEGLARGADAVRRYVEQLLARLGPIVARDAVALLRRRLEETFLVFDENMAHLGFAILVHTVRPEDFEPALYA